MGKFQIFRSSVNQEYYYRLRASGNNEIILSGEGYKTLQSCKDGIASVKTNALSEANYEKLYTAYRQYHFNLKAGNYQVVGTSESYTTSTARDAGIVLVRLQAPSAPIEDLT